MIGVSCLAPGFPEELFRVLAGVVGADVWFERHTSGPLPGDDPFADGRADLGWICSTSYADQRWAVGSGVRLVGVAWVPDDPDADGRPVYFGDLVVAPGSDIARVRDLVDRRVGCNEPVSLSGHHALRFAASEHDMDLSTVDIAFTGGHHRSLDLVVAGELDAAVVDSVVRRRRARHDTAVRELRVAARFGPWPVQPLVVRADLDDDEVSSIRQRLLAARSDSRVRSALADAALVDLVAVGDDHYEPVRQALAQSGWR